MSQFTTWTVETNATPIVVTGNTTTAPDGTTTADTLAIPSVTGPSSQFSQIYKIENTTIGSEYVYSVWLRASAPCTVYIWALSNTTNYSRAVNLTTTWQKCTLKFSAIATTAKLHIGVNTFVSGQSSKPACTVYAWSATIQLYQRDNKLLNSLVCWHSLDGSLAENTSNAIGSLTPTGTMIYQPGMRGQQCIDTQNGGYASYPNLNATTNWFASIWFKITGSLDDGGIFMMNDLTGIRTYGGVRLRWWVSTDWSSQGDLPTNTWHHLVFGRILVNGVATGDVYLNGKLHFHLPQAVTASNPNRIGYSSTAKFYGCLQDAAWWSRPVTASDVALLYNNGRGLSYQEASSIINGTRSRAGPAFFSDGLLGE